MRVLSHREVRAHDIPLVNVAGMLLYAKIGFAPFAVEPRTDWSGSRVAPVHMRLSAEAMEAFRRGQ